MSEKLKIQGNKLRILISSWEDDQFVLAVLLLIIKNTLDGRAKLVKLKKIAFIFDAVKKDLKISKISTALSSPWAVSGEIRKKMILAYEKGLVLMDSPNSEFGFKLTEYGGKVVSEIEEKDILPTIRVKITKLCKGVSDKELKSQDLIW